MDPSFISASFIAVLAGEGVVASCNAASPSWSFGFGKSRSLFPSLDSIEPLNTATFWLSGFITGVSNVLLQTGGE